MLHVRTRCFLLQILTCVWAVYCRPTLPGDLAGPDAPRLQRRSDDFKNRANLTEIISRFETITGVMQTGSSANSIKSLSFIANPEISSCNQDFNFTLAAVKTSEFVLQAKLQLYVHRSYPSASNYVVTIRTRQKDGQLSNSSLMKEITPANDEYVDFEVTELLKPLLSTESNVVFNIQVQRFHINLKTLEPLKCGEDLQFVSTDSDQAVIPVLIVLSYDRRLHSLSYAAIERKILEAYNESAESPNVSGGLQRRKREFRSCTDFPLVIPTSAITQEMIGGTSFSILSPVSYDARICGGLCYNNYPTARIAHAQVVHLHLRVNPNHHGYSLSQCCLPASYDTLTITGSEPGAPIAKLILEHMKVNKCGCLDIAD